jgi:hypothetical protein
MFIDLARSTGFEPVSAAYLFKYKIIIDKLLYSVKISKLVVLKNNKKICPPTTW